MSRAMWQFNATANSQSFKKRDRDVANRPMQLDDASGEGSEANLKEAPSKGFRRGLYGRGGRGGGGLRRGVRGREREMGERGGE